MAVSQPSWEVLKQLAEAMGIGDLPISKLSFECSVKDVCKVTVETFATKEQMVAMAEVLRNAKPDMTIAVRQV